jgi:hypothetical protein
MASDHDRSLVWSMVGRRLTVIAGALAVVLALVVMVVGVVLIRTTQQTNAPKIDHTAQTLKAVKQLAVKINSCVDPRGACAARGRRSTAAAVGDISVRQVAAVACADQPGTQTAPQIKACVARTVRVLAAANAGRKP